MFRYVPKIDLASALEALKKAHALVLSVRERFLTAGEIDGAARMLDTAGRIADEAASVEAAISRG